MGFHDKPHTKGVKIGGKHTYRDLGLVLVDGTESIGLPEVQTYNVEIPGRNGLLDLTEALNGDVTYKNRTCSWQFADARKYGERTKALVDAFNMIHGRRFNFVLDDRPQYTGTGRFTASIDTNRSGYTLLTITADCEPYFSKGLQTLRVNAAGGITITVESGRMPVCPKLQFNKDTIVMNKDVNLTMQRGTYRINDLWFHQGSNKLYLNSYLGPGNVPISDYADKAISPYRKSLISEIMWEGIRGAAVAIAAWANDAIIEHQDTRITDTEYSVSTDTEEYAVYIQYEWKDL